MLLFGVSSVPTASVGGRMGAYDRERGGEGERRRSKQGGRDGEDELKEGWKADKERNE